MFAWFSVVFKVDNKTGYKETNNHQATHVDITTHYEPITNDLLKSLDSWMLKKKWKPTMTWKELAIKSNEIMQAGKHVGQSEG